jgi:threonylcarbamoyladenosine tRNA methylthiotransferase MtaB
MNFAMTTFGCKANQYDSAGIIEFMRQNGYTQVASGEDIHIINSCTVTGNADRKVKSLISRLKHDNPAVKVVLCGCLTKAFPDIETAADEVIIGKFADNLPISLQSERTRAFLKIQDGCNRSCAYCIIPRARGQVTSREIADITAEARLLAAAGHKELVITGINLCLYEHGLVNAVKAVCGVDGLVRVRLGSLEPDMITEKDIQQLSELLSFAKPAYLCNHFHLSLQSGCDTVLERMNRRYTTDDYRRLVGIIRANCTNTAITTDIIAGFPGETDIEFEQTLSFVREMEFAKVHTFAFSKREGTLAADMSGQVPNTIKRERVKQLCQAADNTRLDFFKSLVGTTQETLMEKSDLGHTSCYTPVKTLIKHEKNEIVKIKITGAEKDYCIGD